MISVMPLPDGLFIFPGAGPLWLSIKLAGITAGLLLIISTPIAWGLSRMTSSAKPLIEAIVAMPLVLPPTVLGFYMLVLLGPNGPVGGPWAQITGEALTFSFTGLVIASIVYSLPFVVQPIQNAFETVGRGPVEAAAILGAAPLDAFVSVILPLSLRGYVTALAMGFAHTLGEFGVVLMVGGNIPGETRVISVAIYDHVEMLDYGYAHAMSGALLIFSLLMLGGVYLLNHRWRLSR